MDQPRNRLKHDLLNQLNSISLSLQVLKAYNIEDEARPYFASIEEAVVKLTQLIHEVPNPADDSH
jgi:hypothetical protein